MNGSYNESYHARFANDEQTWHTNSLTLYQHVVTSYKHFCFNMVSWSTEISLKLATQ